MTNNPENPLAERLRAARKASMTQLDLANTLKWAPSKISKIESGRQLPAKTDLTAWAEGTGASESELQTWLSMLDQARAQHRLWSDQLRAGQAATQMDYRQLVEMATRFRWYQKSYIPLFLQTPAYTRSNLTYVKSFYQPDVDLNSNHAQADLEAAVGARQSAAQKLFDPDRSFEFILDEAVLRTRRYSDEIWAAQLAKVASVVGLANVRLGIIPLDRILPIFNSNSFAMYGDVVCVESFVDEVRVVDADDVAAYHGHMDRLWTAAVADDEALDLIEKARRSLSH